MNSSIKKGVSFGLTSGIITTIGVMIGLQTGTGLKLAVIGGILTVAIADAFSDALGMNNSEESNKKNNREEIRKTATATFFSKLIVGLSFLIPIFFFNLDTAIIINLVWGLFLLSVFSFQIAKIRKENPLNTLTWHIGIAVIVIIATYITGMTIAKYFG